MSPWRGVVLLAVCVLILVMLPLTVSLILAQMIVDAIATGVSWIATTWIGWQESVFLAVGEER